MSRAFVTLLLVCGIAFPVASGAAQDKPPKRPRLAAAADTNDSRAYYNRGLELLERDPGKAEDAFYWASRLEPTWAEAFYARRVAGFMARDRILVRYLDGVRATVRSKRGAGARFTRVARTDHQSILPPRS